MAQISSTLGPHEQLRYLMIAATPGSVDTEVVTLTFKVKRERTEDFCGSYNESWAASGKNVIWHERKIGQLLLGVGPAVTKVHQKFGRTTNRYGPRIKYNEHSVFFREP